MATAKRARLFRPAVRWFCLLALLAVAFLIHSVTERVNAGSEARLPVRPALRFDDDLIATPLWAARPDQLLATAELPVEFQFRRGETLGAIVDTLGLEADEGRALVAEIARHVDVRRIRPVDRYAAMIDERSRLQGMRLTLDGKGHLYLRRAEGDWSGRWVPFLEERKTRVLRGSLEGALEVSIRRAGGEFLLAYEMAEVLQWDLDFNRDLRLGDTFELVFEEVFVDGKFARIGEIFALVYVNNGRRLEAFRFGPDGGHYDAGGKPMRKLFLRSPLRYSRITSGFSGRRFHPVLKRYRPHYGVDYGAPVGTPVRVTGSGTVGFAGWSGGGGKTVKVRHPNGYMTAYLHLSRFANGVRPGKRVKQGDVIGFVGSTGLATGPHLDYRIQRDGRWINPLSLDNKPADPIPPEQMAEFAAWRDRLLGALASGEPVEPPEWDAFTRVASTHTDSADGSPDVLQ